jgi:serine protease DegQ
MKQLTGGLVLLALAAPLAADEARKNETRAYRVPYRLTNTNHLLVRVKINGKGPYNFILDTGAPALFVSTALCKKLGIEADQQKWGVFDRFDIEGGVVLNKIKGRVEDPFQLEGMNGLGLAGVPLHGILGYTVLARYRLEFDFTRHKMGWTPLDFKPPRPEGLGGEGMTGMDALGSIMKLLGAFLGKKPEQEVALRGFLGIGLEDLEDTVVVRSILAESPAAQSGLKVGDRISHFQGVKVRSIADVQRRALKLTPDEVARLTVTRGADTLAVDIKAGKGL